MSDYPVLDQADLKGKKVLLRAGFDVPIEDGVVTDTTRIDAVVPTMKYILDHGAALIIMAHQGRPKEGPDPKFSQKPLVPVLEKILGVAVQFAERCASPEAKEAAEKLRPGEVLLLENLRFEKGEKSKDPAVRDALAKELAALADLYVNDAFTNCHRDHASMTGVPKYLPGYLGFNVHKELEGLSKATKSPAHPVVLIISGAKTETKVPVIDQFLKGGDDILVGGVVANTMLAGSGIDVGASKYDVDFLAQASELCEMSGSGGNAKIHLPTDAVVAGKPAEDAKTSVTSVKRIPGDQSVFDIGPETVQSYFDIIAKAKTIVWNGPLGFYELSAFSGATKKIAEAVKAATARGAISVIGGGDTLDFHERYGYPLGVYTFVSTAGGAMLDFISGVDLPAIEALKR